MRVQPVGLQALQICRAHAPEWLKTVVQRVIFVGKENVVLLYVRPPERMGARTQSVLNC